MAAIAALCTTIVGKILLSILVYIIGKAVIGKILQLASKIKSIEALDPNVRTFTVSAIKWILYVVLIVSIVAILGVPMASVITVLGTAGAAVALALQGSLSNLAGGIMLVIFKPFKVGDYVETSGVQGVVRSINLFYTVLITLDNKCITVPNGTLMNANVIDYSTEPTRRVDLTFLTARSEEPARIQALMKEVMAANDKVLADPAPFAQISGGTNEALEFTVRAWCATADYWDVYFALIQEISEKLGANSVQSPAVRIITDK
ncbi:MAG: mechanosensitive ion channel [Oscillospiraceae bacterium]|nr:mechanosensitive ion channel [Oscillospiraceae bacterium]